jgi:hypothetical protein
MEEVVYNISKENYSELIIQTTNAVVQVHKQLVGDGDDHRWHRQAAVIKTMLSFNLHRTAFVV